VLRLGRPQAVFHSAVQLQLLQLLLLVRPLPQRLVSVRPQGLSQRRILQAEGSPSVRQRAVHRALAQLQRLAAPTHRPLVVLAALLVGLRPGAGPLRSRLEEMLALLQQVSNSQGQVRRMRPPSAVLNQETVVAEALHVLGGGGGRAIAAEADAGEMVAVIEGCNGLAVAQSVRIVRDLKVKGGHSSVSISME